jgi:hypothetical protein
MANYNVSYQECFEHMHKLEERAKLDRAALEKLRIVEQENGALRVKLRLLEEENRVLKSKLTKVAK